MTDFVVHGIPGSPFMRSVMVALEEKRAPYRVKALAPGDIRGEEYRALQPFARVPAIEHGDFRLYETQAILRYIDAAFSGPELQPKEAMAIGRMSQIMGINDWYFFPKVAAAIVFQRIVGPALMGLTPDEARIADALPDAKLCLGELNRLLGGRAYLAGDAFSLADALLAPQLYYLALTPEGASLLNGTPLHKWIDRMNQRPSMQNTLPPEVFRQAA
jgi:glutathione S-transferase